MKWHTYALASLVRNYIYVGITSNLKKRIAQHNAGKERTTRPYRPFRLLLSEAFSTRIEARRREVWLKSGIGKEFLRKLARERQGNTFDQG
jgi:putative endonuclease